jgi:preprotein translocase subunit Sss1
MNPRKPDWWPEDWFEWFLVAMMALVLLSAIGAIGIQIHVDLR